MGKAIEWKQDLVKPVFLLNATFLFMGKAIEWKLR